MHDAKSKGVQNSSMTDGDISSWIVVQNFALSRIKNYLYNQTYTFTVDRNGKYMSFFVFPAITSIIKKTFTMPVIILQIDLLLL